MELALSEDQVLFRDTSRKFLESSCSTAEVRRLAEVAQGGFDRAWWRQGAELGWTSMLVPEADGGGSISGLGLVDLALVAHEMGRFVAPGPLVPVNVVASALARSGTAAQKDRVLPGLLAGSAVAAWCLGARAAGVDGGGQVVAAIEPDGRRWRLRGRSAAVEAAGQADTLLVTAVSDEGLVQCLVPAGAPGLRVEPMRSLDLVRRHAVLCFEDVVVEEADVLGAPGQAAADVEHQLRQAVVLQCAEMAGALARVVALTVEYASARYSFGRPLASYQALKHRFADLEMWRQVAQATAAAAAMAVATSSGSAPELVSVAKATIGSRAHLMVQDCVQLHGGIGVTWDHDLHLYLRRVVSDRATYGTPDEHLARIASLIIEGSHAHRDAAAHILGGAADHHDEAGHVLGAGPAAETAAGPAAETEAGPAAETGAAAGTVPGSDAGDRAARDAVRHDGAASRGTPGAAVPGAAVTTPGAAVTTPTAAVTTLAPAASVDPEREEEDVAAFRERARRWLAANMPRLPAGYDNRRLALEDESGERARALQRTLFDGGFGGICFPVAYGGAGLTRAHQQAFNEESRPYQMPVAFNVPTRSILAPTLLDFGTEAQKRRHIPAILRGDELWVQFLSEPSGGSDLAGLVTRATADGDVFVLNGSKIWSTGAMRADYAMCLARTNWHVPKHRGLTMFIVKIHQPGIEVRQIEMANGSAEFCQEFFDDVAVPASDVVGEVNDGWTVASRLLFHERDAVGGGSPYISGVSMGTADRGGQRYDLVDLARETGQLDDPRVRSLVAEARAGERIQQQLVDWVTIGIRAGAMPAAATALTKLLAALITERRRDIGLDIAGLGAVAWPEGDPMGSWGTEYLVRQGVSLGGGSNEMQRNIISERVLGMPREHAADRDKPFDEVRHNA